MNIMRSTRASLAGALLLAFLVVNATPARAQLFRSTAKVGTTAAQFLKIGVGARAIGMGGAQVGVTGDISSIYWNPAALSRMNVNSELTFNHANWLADINYDFAAGVMPIGELGTFGLSVISMRVPEEIVRTVDFPERRRPEVGCKFHRLRTLVRTQPDRPVLDRLHGEVHP